MQEEKQLSIGLFEENPGRLVILHLFLTQAGYAVAVCCEGGRRPAAWLSPESPPLSPSGLSTSDLLIVDVAEGALLANAEVFAHLQKIVGRQTPPLIMLTSSLSDIPEAWLSHHRIEGLSFRGVEQIPHLFQTIERLTGVASPISPAFLLRVLQQLHELNQHLRHDELVWLDQRSLWLSQRQEWVEQRASWLITRRAWLEQHREEPNCQQEWLEEQLAWVEQQEQEVGRERSRIEDLSRWLRRAYSTLDEPGQPPDRLVQ